jgi:hypothetical protein
LMLHPRKSLFQLAPRFEVHEMYGIQDEYLGTPILGGSVSSTVLREHA